MTPKKWYECSFKALYVLKTFLQLVRLLFMNIWKSHSYKFMLRCSKIKPLKLWQNEKRWTLRISKTFFGFWVETYGLYKNTRIYLKSMSWKKKANVPPSNRPVPLQCSVSNAARRYCRKFNRISSSETKSILLSDVPVLKSKQKQYKVQLRKARNVSLGVCLL